MADKKLNAVSTASDGAYIYAEDASGNQIKISKADLASVVAGVLGIQAVIVTLDAGGTHTIPNSAVKALTILSFSGTSYCNVSIWNRGAVSANLNESIYFSIGADASGTVCLLRDSSNNFLIKNNRADSVTVRLSYFGVS